jgi:DNA polymerase-1
MLTQPSIESGILNYGPHRFGAKLIIDPEPGTEVLGESIAVDVETNGADDFVGLAICSDPLVVYYYTVLTPSLCSILSSRSLIGHNIKFDAHWLKRWGVDITPSQLVHDTMIMSYVRNSTKDSHGLKELAKEYLGMTWPTYKEMVGTGKNKTDLSKKSVLEVANYCGCDTLATKRLELYFNRQMTPNQKRFYNTIEMPLLRMLFKMEDLGVTVDVDYLRSLDTSFSAKYAEKLQEIRTLLSCKGYKPKCSKTCPKKEHIHEFNPASPVQVKAALNQMGFFPKATDKFALEVLRGDEFVDKLFEFREVNKVKSTYIEPYLELKTLPLVKTTFNQVTYDKAEDEWKGIRTGRLSSSGPNLHNIPAPKDKEDGSDSVGELVRRMFIPSSGKTLIVADYKQIEYRLLAHFSKEPKLLEAFKNGKDVHEETGKALGVDRRLGKTLNFAAIYGAQGPKIARTAKISEEDAKRFLAEYWRVLPKVTAWINRVKLEAKIHRAVRTMFGRVIPLPGIADPDMYTRWHWERASVNYVIQGSAADIIKMAMLECEKAKYMPILQVHDELLFEVNPNQNLPKQKQDIASLMASVVSLDIPLDVSIGHGPNWAEAKG